MPVGLGGRQLGRCCKLSGTKKMDATLSIITYMSSLQVLRKAVYDGRHHYDYCEASTHTMRRAHALCTDCATRLRAHMQPVAVWLAQLCGCVAQLRGCVAQQGTPTTMTPCPGPARASATSAGSVPPGARHQRDGCSPV